MLRTLLKLARGADAAAEAQLRHAQAIPLIDQRIRDSEASLSAAKVTLASLIQRLRNETRFVDALDSQIEDLTQRAQAALAADRADLAQEAAEAIAELENERALRRETQDRLDQKVARLKASVAAAHRRIVDLRQGATAARAVRDEHRIQRRLLRSARGPAASCEARDLINAVLSEDDPFEEAQILEDIDADLTKSNLATKMAAQGFGKAPKSTGADVLARLKTQE